MAKTVQYLGTGRRKSSVARVRLVPGTGQITINKRPFEDFIPSAHALGQFSFFIREMIGRIYYSYKY